MYVSVVLHDILTLLNHVHTDLPVPVVYSVEIKPKIDLELLELRTKAYC